MHRYVQLVLLCSLTLLAGESFAAARVETLGTTTDVKQVGPEVLAKQMEGKTFYSYEVLPAGELRDKDGSVVPFHTLLEHLQSTKPDKDGFFEFRIAGPQQMNLARVAMDIFEQYGAKNFSVRVPPGSLPPTSSTRPVPASEAAPNERIPPPTVSSSKTSAAASAADKTDADVEVKEMNASAAQIDKVLEGKQTYNFVIISADEFVDQDGRHFSPHAIKAYLEKVKPDKKAAYIFWMRDKTSVEIVKAAVPAFTDYGAAMIVVREMDKPGKSSTPPATDDKRPKKLALVGVPNPQSHSASDLAPAMLGRPVHLRPGQLPRRVRYQFKSDSEVMAAAELVRSTFLTESTAPDSSALAATLSVQPGVWAKISTWPTLKEAKLLHAQIELTDRVAVLDFALLNGPEQTAAVAKEVQSWIHADGGGVLRALSTEEMNHWWTYIATDIEEPVFVIETNGGHRKFIIGCHKNKISLIDDLDALPTK